MRRSIVLTGAVIATAALAAPVAVADTTTTGAPDLGRQVLGERDGWAAAEGGTTGGAAAEDDAVFHVGNRAELVAALDGGSPTPKIIYVDGAIEGHEADDGTPLSCADFADPDYSLDDYLAAYDPEHWGYEEEPHGPLEDARDRSMRNQRDHIQVRVGSNTTLVGLGADAEIRGLNLSVRDADNVIIRNITFEAPVDCFPAWDPTDNEAGEWNSEYDAVELHGATHVWVDHNTFHDGRYPDSSQPWYFGRPYQWHDGLLDMVRETDLVTVSWNVFRDHDKTMLIGNSNSRFEDRGKLRITLHHNVFSETLERSPRVRFGQVHVYNNYYESIDGLGYHVGVGVESKVVTDNNYFRLGERFTAGDVVYDWGGTAIRTRGDVVEDQDGRRRVDLRAEHNLAHGSELSADVGWVPRWHERIHPASAVPGLVPARAGAGRVG
ncbi:pectate lyase family protein [Actinoalloteichus caeruleus]|uniref:Pectate lyase n=1 Tax=Actinoalloteichus caeruleus DSM 43889 TaxID=1120930 RepID=A0ABT1JNY4_ACTCY|nr:hypothetical protein [Actinoalloteichus caeruleus]MCP2333869.1 pectate lyase [Actinoalloteichus caeruleus DSM 43889]